VFTGLSAFPLTPLDRDRLDEAAFARLVARLAQAGVDSITALGSTGSYAYLTREERARAARLAVEHAGEVPVMVGIGALRTSHVLELAADAQAAGASAVLLAPVSYQPLTPDDVYGLYADVAAELSVPLVVYDNPGTTRFAFTDELYRALAELPAVASIKIPGVPADPAEAAERVSRLRALLPDGVTLGVSGDALASTGLNAGCDAWYSVVGGTLPGTALAITRAAQAGDAAGATQLSARLQPLWDLFARHGSLRVVAAIAEHLGLAKPSCLPLPLRGLGEADRAEAARVAEALGLAP
jgi:4-hydroxy-tetrahydrodipicolinate synthase